MKTLLLLGLLSILFIGFTIISIQSVSSIPFSPYWFELPYQKTWPWLNPLYSPLAGSGYTEYNYPPYNYPPYNYPPYNYPPYNYPPYNYPENLGVTEPLPLNIFLPFSFLPFINPSFIFTNNSLRDNIPYWQTASMPYTYNQSLRPSLIESKTRVSSQGPMEKPQELPVFGYKSPAIQDALSSYIPGQPAYISGQVVVTFRQGTPPVEINRVCVTHQCQPLYTSPYAGFKILSLPTYLTVFEGCKRLSGEASILHVSPNYYRHAHLIPNDPYYVYQWHLKIINCGYAWDINTGLGAVVGLLDSGVAYQTVGIYGLAPDLTGTVITPGYDFINNDAFPDDDYGHGTHMAGCIAQTTNNFLGVAGVAFNSAIMPVKVMNNTGYTLITAEVDGIYFAVNNGANIINMSLGGPATDVTEQAAVTYAYNAGVTIICSAGNQASSIPEYPASYPECISVSSIRYDQTIAPYSNYGAYIDVCAPGGDLTVDQNLDGFVDGILQQTHNGVTFTSFNYYFMEGTSPACALVSGVSALIISKSTIPLTPAQVTSILQTTATDLGVIGWDQYYGYGLVNAYLAVLQTP